MIETNAAELRDRVAQLIAPTIEIHRESRGGGDEVDHERPTGPPTDEEVDEFLFHNALLDEETIEQLVDPGLLGHLAKRVRATEEWIAEFEDHVSSWAENESWLAADLPWRELAGGQLPKPRETHLWVPDGGAPPGWLATAPASLLMAADLLRSGRLLSEMGWRDFEELIGTLLEGEGWQVEVTKPSRDGGFDIRAVKVDPTMGDLTSIWQAKKYSAPNKVKLHEVRELSAVREEQRATKALMVTTSRLTRDAVDWIRRDLYRMGYKEHDHVRLWIEGLLLGKDEVDRGR